MSYLIQRGPRARAGKAKAHLARYDQWGNIAGSWCGAAYSLASNVPWGLKCCKHCLRLGNYR